jgi:hypothetical protein
MANPSPSSGPLIPTKSSPPSGEGIKCWIQSTSEASKALAENKGEKICGQKYLR